MGRAKLPYSTAFKQQIVDLAIAGRTPAELSREFEGIRTEHHGLGRPGGR